MKVDEPAILTRDPLLERLVQPLSEESKDRLKEEMIRDPAAATIHVWQGVNLFDYEKYDLCRSHSLSYTVEEHDFSGIHEAASFVCSEQLTRSDLTGEYRKYLIGQKFHYEEARYLASQPEKNTVKYRIAYKLGEDLNLAGGTIIKYSIYASSLEAIFAQSEELAQRILSGKIRVSHENVIELSRLSSDELKTLSRTVINEEVDHLTFQEIRHEVKRRYTQVKAPVSRSEMKEQRERLEAGIRQMPAFDPDSDVNSLCMTIVSWVSSIERVSRTADFHSVSNRAKLELMKQLTVLERTISAMQKSLVERTTK
jgi:hypothetical protein